MYSMWSTTSSMDVSASPAPSGRRKAVAKLAPMKVQMTLFFPIKERLRPRPAAPMRAQQCVIVAIKDWHARQCHRTILLSFRAAEEQRAHPGQVADPCSSAFLDFLSRKSLWRSGRPILGEPVSAIRFRREDSKDGHERGQSFETRPMGHYSTQIFTRSEIVGSPCFSAGHLARDRAVFPERHKLVDQGRTTMPKTWLLATVLALSPTLTWGQTTEELNADGKNPDNVLTQSMGLARNSYSPLAQINKSNIKRLVPIWSTSLMSDTGELAAPVVYDGVIYAINAKWTFAIDVATGRQIWRTPVQYEPGSARAATAIYRGAPAIYNGKLFRVTVDNHLIALDMKTGRVLWNQKFAEGKEGYHSSGAPIVANGVLISGMAGGESTTRGFLDGWDPDTGTKLWRPYTIPAPGEPGSETWPANSDAWKYGGGPTWRSGSYDPELDLVYWGTGNAEPYDPRPREARDSLYTSSVLAIRPKTGELVCYYQYTPNDVYDVDGTDQQVLADLRVGGQMRKVMIQSNKNGFM
jgi:outer membrane protein assembly factor BamB